MIKNNVIFQKIYPIVTDNVLIYTVIIISSIMYHYHSSMTPVYTVLALIIVFLLHKIFDFIAKHKIIGPITYIAIFIVGIIIIKAIIDIGASEYPIGFMLWFITPQDALEFSFWYTIALYIFLIGFFSSIVYYFTKIRYRIPFGFLTFIIPFTFYGKEYEKMPIIYIILLCIYYVINMIYFRMMNDENVTIVNKPQMWISIFVYTLIFGTIASLSPKLPIKEDRSQLESLFNMDQLTDMLISRISFFNRSTDSNTFTGTVQNNTIIYYATADEPLRLKTQIYNSYDFSNDSWSFENHSDDSTKTMDSPLKNIKSIIALDKENFKDISHDDIPDVNVKTLTIYSDRYISESIPLPTLWKKVISPNKDDYDAVYSFLISKNTAFPIEQDFVVDYYSDDFLYNPSIVRVLESISYMDSHNSDVEDIYLDYGDIPELKDLADEITQGAYSDFEKARKLEDYFLANDFIYDLSYRKPKTDNVLNFLFESKTGVCYEYATAMVLLARASGVPARYAEGFYMNENFDYSKYNSNYVIRAKDAHGFPEIYIDNVGWISFEPTRTLDLQTSENSDKGFSEKFLLFGVFFAIICCIVIFILHFHSNIYNTYFKIKLKFATPDESAQLVFLRMRKLSKFNSSITVFELYKHLQNTYNFDILILKDIFEKSAYANYSVSESEKTILLALYNDFYFNVIKRKISR